MKNNQEKLEKLFKVLSNIGESAIAVSGGIDSLTLATIAYKAFPDSKVFHALSPAVPKQATQRVKDFSARYNWSLELFDAGEFSDLSYLKNPINRCFFCKGNLYGAISKRTFLPILSGTNLDDLNDFRPGLIAAKELAVHHPYVEAGINKNDIRNLAQYIGLNDIADLPASPCLSSRVSTGISIKSEDLNIIERVETAMLKRLGKVTARCRLTHEAFRIEIDPTVLDKMDDLEQQKIVELAREELRPTDRLAGLFPYGQGNAFIHES